jgi:coenzyme F420-dependent glucose-6-phosphate dehydrogenase
MVSIGYWLSTEEHAPADLVANARHAESLGFEFAIASDHYHPWNEAQGQSPFVWTLLGALAEATERMELGTGVTCPTIRIHPAIIAQAAATTAAMLPGQFFLGVGTGEYLNEHVLGDAWPRPPVRLDMLEEAVEVIRGLWEGEDFSHDGAHYTVEDARIYTLPPGPPRICMAAGGPIAAATAGRIADGLMSFTASRELVQRFEEAGGAGKPRYGQLTVCWAPSEAEARRTACELWPTAGFPAPLGTDLRRPADFEAVRPLASEDSAARHIVCGPDPERHFGAIREFLDAGFDHIALHQVGHDQEGFFRFFEAEIRPRLRDLRSAARLPAEARR